MTYNLKKEHLKQWDLHQANEKPMIHIENDDDQDIYISERSSVASSTDMNQTQNPIGKRLPTPTISILPVPINRLPLFGILIMNYLKMEYPLLLKINFNVKKRRKRKKIFVEVDLVKEL